MRGTDPIRKRSVLLGAAILLAACSDGASGAKASGSGAQNETEKRFREWQALVARIEAGADPQADAAAAIARQDFGLLIFEYDMASQPRPIGVTCFTPMAKAPRIRAVIGGGDAIGDREMRVLRYGEAYNHIIVEHADFPDADLCRIASRDDRIWPPDTLPSQPAREVTHAPRSLHEAARRGSAAELKRFGRAEIDSVDGLGMTPLAWSVARGNTVAIDYLIGAGADPWKGDEMNGDAVYWSAALARADIFTRLAQRPGKPFEEWPRWYLRAAALAGGPVLDIMLSQPHEKLDVSSLGHPLPAAAIIERLLRDDPTQADRLLARAVGAGGAGGARPELVALALRHGANPNAEAYSSRTVLGEIAGGLDPASPEIVDMLLKAGADPNALSWLDRPAWIAIRTTRVFPGNTQLKARAIAIYRRLRQAGANLNLPNGEGVPQIRTLLFPSRYDHDELDAGPGTPEVLEMLVGDGLDLNAPWRGRRVLGLVEEQTGPNSPLAATLRRLGAKP